MTLSTGRRARRAARREARRVLPLRRRLLPTWRICLGTVFGVLLIAVGAFAVLYVIVPLPDPNAQAVAQSNIYLYSDGVTEIARTGAVNRTDVDIERIPVSTRQAVVSAEDRTFYQNRGIDLKGMVRAGWNTLTGQGMQGGSTITQQYVKNYYLTQSRTIERKGRELLIALKVDQQRDKNEILAGYLNTSYFGRGAYGIQSAARAYYGIDVSELTLPQSAYLAALLQAPSAYDVKTATPANRERALARWQYTLDGMVQLGFISATERADTAFPDPIDPQPATGLAGQAGYLVGVADDYLVTNRILDSATLKAGGWRITTTFDQDKQDAFARAVHEELTDELDPAARPATDTDVRVAGASVDPATGRVVAVYGGPDYAKQPYNDALRQDNQIGSTFKPIDLAAGLDSHRGSSSDGLPISTETRYDGTSERPVTDGPTPYAPPNEDDIDYGSITLRQAMVKSVNSVYAQEGVDAGLAHVRETAVRLGIPADVPGMDPANTSMTLGTATPSALDLAGVYAALANHGEAHRPWSVAELERVNPGPGQLEVPDLPDQPGTTALDRGTADAVTDVLRDVIGPRGTGAAALDLGRPAAGKTGTTDANLSAWFAGYTPELATTVGLFRENPKTHAKEPLAGTAGYARINGGAFPTRIWTSYMADALDGTVVRSFDLQPAEGNRRPGTAGPSTTPTTTAPASASPSADPAPSPPAGGTGGTSGTGGTGGVPVPAAPAPSAPRRPTATTSPGTTVPDPVLTVITPEPPTLVPPTQPEPTQSQPSPTARPSTTRPTTEPGTTSPTRTPDATRSPAPPPTGATKPPSTSRPPATADPATPPPA
ncbi:transglycosylase domain-containing protein [Kitasatospora purpeofusca]|uniref:Transglycosylase domain-containing protein n=1 Tax=Kitasatospora purpeofusca TaxID=67352 RepID=A0ABZ1U7L8_9ACTN|nr:transglycosylase domain-containing protein [Kitasatospora purpeofusca]